MPGVLVCFVLVLVSHVWSGQYVLGVVFEVYLSFGCVGFSYGVFLEVCRDPGHGPLLALLTR